MSERTPVYLNSEDNKYYDKCENDMPTGNIVEKFNETEHSIGTCGSPPLPLSEETTILGGGRRRSKKSKKSKKAKKTKKSKKSKKTRKARKH